MIKILIIVSIVLIAYWLGKQSVLSGRKKVEEKKTYNKDNVIDIEPED